MKKEAKVQKDWKETKADLKKKLVHLTDNDLLFAKNGKEELLVKTQLKLGKTKEELAAIIAAL
jgi:hypothetical protein